jgi:hypothetical protein
MLLASKNRLAAAAGVGFAAWIVAPGAAGAQTLTVSSTAFGPPACVAGEDLTVIYNYAGDGCGENGAACAPLTTGAQIQIFATQEACPWPPTGQGNVTLPSDAIDVLPVRAATMADLSDSTIALSVVTLAQSDCQAPVDYAWNFCMYDYWQEAGGVGQGVVDESSIFSPPSPVVYVGIPPSAPVITSVDAGEVSLTVAIADAGDVQNYVVLVTPAVVEADGGVIPFPVMDGGSGTETSICLTGSATISTALPPGAISGPVPAGSAALEAGTRYWVQAYAVDEIGLDGPCSVAVLATTREAGSAPVDAKSSGCSQSSGSTTGLLVSLLGLGLGIRRPGRRVSPGGRRPRREAGRQRWPFPTELTEDVLPSLPRCTWRR